MMATAILQARMGSSRLPGKTMMPIFEGRNALELMLLRLGRSRLLERIIVATTTGPEDDVLAGFCSRSGITCFRGASADVLDRYYQCALTLDARGTLVRLTSDCPLHDPEVVDQVIEFFEAGDFDYAANTHPPTYPDGLDAEVFSFAALQNAWRKATLVTEREHVTYYFYTHPEECRVGNLVGRENYSALRWTLDEPQDLDFLRQVYAALGRPDAGWREVLELLRQKPELLEINQTIGRNEGLAKSLAFDRQLGNLPI
jgi:spore coat polysaccharide biosynthesis protein SpsF